MAFRKGSVLDQWAKALDVTTDADAMKALAGLMGKIRAALEQAAKVADAIADAPEPHVAAKCRKAAGDAEAAHDYLVGVYRRFQAHERG